MPNQNIETIRSSAADIETALTALYTATDTAQKDWDNQAAALNSAKSQVEDLQAKLQMAMAQIPKPPATVPLASLMAHNISNSPNYNRAGRPSLFTGSTHHDTSGTAYTVDPTLVDDSCNTAAPVNVSKVPLRTLMPPGWGGKIINWMQAWWGSHSHPDIGYSNSNPDDMARIITDSAARGYDVVCLDWYGIQHGGAGDDAVLDLIAALCFPQTFCVSIDAQYLKAYQPAQYQSAMASAINHLAGKYFSHPQYEKYAGRPLLLLWNLESVAGVYVDWVALKTQIAGNPLLIHYQANGFKVPGSDGAFFWVDPSADTFSGTASGVTYLTNYALPSIAAHQEKICISSVWAGFNGTLTRKVSWSDGKFIARQGGKTWLDTWKANRDFVAGGMRLDYVIPLTWDDYEEGTALQAGILNDVAFASAVIKGTVLNWAITGNESTVYRYDVYSKTDSGNLVMLTSIPARVGNQVDLAGAVPLGGSIFIQAVGQPGIVNRLSQMVPIAL